MLSDDMLRFVFVYEAIVVNQDKQALNGLQSWIVQAENSHFNTRLTDDVMSDCVSGVSDIIQKS